MEPMQKLERVIKLIVAVISIVGLTFIGLRINASRSRIGLPDPKKDCKAVGRGYDPSSGKCLPPGVRVPVTVP